LIVSRVAWRAALARRGLWASSAPWHLHVRAPYRAPVARASKPSFGKPSDHWTRSGRSSSRRSRPANGVEVVAAPVLAVHDGADRLAAVGRQDSGSDGHVARDVGQTDRINGLPRGCVAGHYRGTDPATASSRRGSAATTNFDTTCGRCEYSPHGGRAADPSSARHQTSSQPLGSTCQRTIFVPPLRAPSTILPNRRSRLMSLGARLRPCSLVVLSCRS